MTIDERLEVLRQSLEVWQHMREAARKEYAEQFSANEVPSRADDERLAQLMDTNCRLGRILEKHGQRPDNQAGH
jgi:hypothetical protein